MPLVDQLGSVVTLAIELLATLAFALSGVMEAARKKLDVVGVCAVSFLAAFGGGTLRDLLLDQRPFFWVQHHWLLLVLLLLCALAMLFLRQSHFEITEKAILWPDALGLGLFTATGVNRALEAGMPPSVAVLLGVVTGICGGVLRDMVCNEIPVTFKDHRPYAVCAFAGGCVFVLLHAMALPTELLMLACITITVATRALALSFNWQTPGWGRGAKNSD